MPTTSQPSSLRILVVDDELSMREILSEFLLSEGHQIATAADGVEALNAFGRSSWDMVFTDRMMPRMGGDELAAAVKKAKPSVPVVMITGFADSRTANPQAQRTIDVLVRKPFTFAALRQAIGEARSLSL